MAKFSEKNGSVKFVTKRKSVNLEFIFTFFSRYAKYLSENVRLACIYEIICFSQLMERD